MKTFEQLIELRNTFDEKTDIKVITEQVSQLTDDSKSLSIDLGESYHNELRKLNYSYEDLSVTLKKISSAKEKAKAIIDQQIKEYAVKFTNDLYEHRITFSRPEEVRSQRLFISSEDACNSAILSIQQYVNWQYPALEIGPNASKWTKYLTGFEPLYLADTHNSFMTDCIQSLEPRYQEKVLSYIIKNRSLSMLPQNQFGFVFSWDFFKYVSLKGLAAYIPEVHKILRPGGTFMFGYNNADLPAAAARADRYEMSYAPKVEVASLLTGNNFIIRRCVDFDKDTSWIEAYKPGELSSVRRHAVLGEIIFTDH